MQNDDNVRYDKNGFRIVEFNSVKAEEIADGKLTNKIRAAAVSESLKGKPKSDEHRKSLSESKKGMKMSEEYCKSVSIRYSGKGNPNYGKKASQETIEKQRQSRIGWVPSNETRENMRNGQLGRKHSQETIEKIRQASSIYTHTEETKQVLSENKKEFFSDVENREKLRLAQYKRKGIRKVMTPDGEFFSAREASEHYNCTIKKIRELAKDPNNTEYYYIKDPNVKDVHDDPEYKAKLARIIEEKKKDPEYKAKLLEKRRNLSKRVMTPDGEFESRKAAAEFYNINVSIISNLIKRQPDQYYYINKED